MVFILLRDVPRLFIVSEGSKTREKADSGRDPSSFRFSRVFCIIHATFYSRFLLDASLVVKGNYFCPITNSIKVKVCLPSFVGKSFFSFPRPLLSLSLLSPCFSNLPPRFFFLSLRLFFFFFFFLFFVFFNYLANREANELLGTKGGTRFALMQVPLMERFY